MYKTFLKPDIYIDSNGLWIFYYRLQQNLLLIDIKKVTLSVREKCLLYLGDSNY